MHTHIGLYLGQLQQAEQGLAEAFEMVASRHDRDPEVRDMCATLATWSWAHVQALEPLIERFGAQTRPDPERLRDALFHGNRFGGVGLLRDLQDLMTMVTRVRGLWTALGQAAHSVKDDALKSASETCCNETFRQMTWLQTQIKQVAPQALAIVAEPASELAASVPRHPTPASVPDALWGPLSGAGLLLGVGAVALLAGQPWLFPSLGPTAYLQAESPAHPTSRWFNVIVGHLIGLLAGFLAVALLNAWGAPSPLQDKVLVASRVGAAVLAMLLTLGVAPLLNASHPPAAATTLLVALGSLTTPADAVNLMIGALILAALGEALRRVRMQRSVFRPALALHNGVRAPGAHLPAGGR
jgi:hypothetical protein